jgi:hypothetical protein
MCRVVMQPSGQLSSSRYFGHCQSNPFLVTTVSRLRLQCRPAGRPGFQVFNGQVQSTDGGLPTQPRRAARFRRSSQLPNVHSHTHASALARTHARTRSPPPCRHARSPFTPHPAKTQNLSQSNSITPPGRDWWSEHHRSRVSLFVLTCHHVSLCIVIPGRGVKYMRINKDL